jgi:hypothetical protein
MPKPNENVNPHNTDNLLPGVPSSWEALSKQSVLDRQPTTQNYIYPTYFQFSIKRLPLMNYFVTKANLPDFGYDSPVEQFNRFTTIKHTANRVIFGGLSISFLVDEDMSNWREIQDWIKSTSVVDNHYDVDKNIKDHYSDATLMILNSAMQPNVEVTFKNVFPTAIAGFDFDSSVTELTPLESIATFAFDYYEIKKL